MGGGYSGKRRVFPLTSAPLLSFFQALSTIYFGQKIVQPDLLTRYNFDDFIYDKEKCKKKYDTFVNVP